MKTSATMYDLARAKAIEQGVSCITSGSRRIVGFALDPLELKHLYMREGFIVISRIDKTGHHLPSILKKHTDVWRELGKITIYDDRIFFRFNTDSFEDLEARCLISNWIRDNELFDGTEYVNLSFTGKEVRA